MALFTFCFFDVTTFRCYSVQKSLLSPLRKVHFPELLQTVKCNKRKLPALDADETFQTMLSSVGLVGDRDFLFRLNSKATVVSGWNLLHTTRLLTRGPYCFLSRPDFFDLGKGI